jgi:hypothetical protein
VICFYADSSLLFPRNEHARNEKQIEALNVIMDNVIKFIQIKKSHITKLKLAFKDL